MRSPLGSANSTAAREARGREGGRIVVGPRRLRGAALPRPDEKARTPEERAPHLEDGEADRSEEHTSELQSQSNLLCPLFLYKNKKNLLLRQLLYDNLDNLPLSTHHLPL